MLQYYILTFVGFIAIVLNSIEVYLIAKKLGYIKPFEQLVLSLACSDIFTGIASITYGCYELAVDGEERGHAMRLNIVVAVFAFTAINLIAIGADRFIAIRFPIKHRNCLTKDRVKIFIILLWIVLLAIIVIGPATAALVTVHHGWAEFYFHWIASEWITWSISMMIVYYSLIVFISLRRRAKMNKQSVTIEVRTTKREVSLIWTCVLSVCLYTATTLPYALHLKQSQKALVYLAILLLSNLIANPIVYFAKTHRDRRNQVTVN